MTATIDAVRRRDWLQAAVSDGVDLVVVGGGITGAGVALDAASRGLRTILLEAEDLAFGTSRWSSKLAHGGLRYLATGDVAVAMESAVERGHLLTTIAPHLVRPARTVLPLVDSVRGRDAALIGAGFAAGDVLRRLARTPGRELGAPRRWSADRTLRAVPALAGLPVRGALMYMDGQLTDDARLVTAVARTAVREGAGVATRCRVTAIGADGVGFEDTRTGESGVIAARAVVNATGVWAAGLAPGLRLSPSRGTHVVLSGAAMPGLDANVMLPYPGEKNRFLLVLPQLDGRIYLGLTDVAADEIEDVPTAAQWEIDEMLHAFSAGLDREVSPAHVLGAFAGLRPLVAGDGASKDLSRQHAVIRGEHGAVHVIGGKLTTYRRMAQDAVDAAVAHTGLAPRRDCATTTIPVVGAASRPTLARIAAQIPERGGVTGGLLVARYGTESPAIERLISADPTLADPVVDGYPLLRAELVWSAAVEGAMSAEDLVDRRFRIGLDPHQRPAALRVATEVTRLQA